MSSPKIAIGHARAWRSYTGTPRVRVAPKRWRFRATAVPSSCSLGRHRSRVARPPSRAAVADRSAVLGAPFPQTDVALRGFKLRVVARRYRRARTWRKRKGPLTARRLVREGRAQMLLVTPPTGIAGGTQPLLPLLPPRQTPPGSTPVGTAASQRKMPRPRREEWRDLSADVGPHIRSIVGSSRTLRTSVSPTGEARSADRHSSSS